MKYTGTLMRSSRHTCTHMSRSTCVYRHSQTFRGYLVYFHVTVLDGIITNLNMFGKLFMFVKCHLRVGAVACRLLCICARRKSKLAVSSATAVYMHACVYLCVCSCVHRNIWVVNTWISAQNLFAQIRVCMCGCVCACWLIIVCDVSYSEYLQEACLDIHPTIIHARGSRECVYILLCIHVYIHVYIFIYIYRYTHIYNYIHIYTRVNIYIYMYVQYKSMSKYICIYICTYTHV